MLIQIYPVWILRPLLCPSVQLHECISTYVHTLVQNCSFLLVLLQPREQVLFTTYTKQTGSRCFPISPVFAAVPSLYSCLHLYTTCISMVFFFSYVVEYMCEKKKLHHSLLYSFIIYLFVLEYCSWLCDHSSYIWFAYLFLLFTVRELHI